jgi:hypothetical protein
MSVIPALQRLKAGGSGVLGQSGLHIVRHCLKEKKKLSFML